MAQWRSREAPPYPDPWHEAAVCRGAVSGRVLEMLRTLGLAAPLRERIVSLQPVGNLWAPTASDIEGPTDLDWVSLCFETEISRCALDSCMAQERSNCLQVASAFQNVESLRPA